MGTPQLVKPTKLSEGVLQDIVNRNISKDTCRKFGVTSNSTKHFYPFYDNEGMHIANKVRLVNSKDFFTEGDISSSMLFGQQVSREGGKYITLVEGEMDALSAYQMLGSKWSVVSVKTGAAGAAKDVSKCYDFLPHYLPVSVSCSCQAQLRSNIR